VPTKAADWLGLARRQQILGIAVAMVFCVANVSKRLIYRNFIAMGRELLKLVDRRELPIMTPHCILCTHDIFLVYNLEIVLLTIQPLHT
jgi:hypothetical protein